MADNRTPRRVLARKITYAGQTYTMHLAEITPEGAVTLTPFTGETHSTLYLDGHICLSPARTPDGTFHWQITPAAHPC